MNLWKNNNLLEANFTINPNTYSYGSSKQRYSLEYMENWAKTDYDSLITEYKKRCKKEGWSYWSSNELPLNQENLLKVIEIIKQIISKYTPEKYAKYNYIRAFRTITVDRSNDFDPTQPGMCWTYSKRYQRKNENSFILDGTGNGKNYALRLEALVPYSEVDWFRTIFFFIIMKVNLGFSKILI